MCELLGMSANVPTDICFSFSGLIKRGGHRGPHKDGWGISFYQGKAVQIFKESTSGAESPIADFLRRHSIKSCTVISHIRLANVGEISLENTHPFVRELWGREWSFAHNGQLKDHHLLKVDQWLQPVGRTDSEMAFCYLLSRLRAVKTAEHDVQVRWQVIAECCAYLAHGGVFNLLASEGDYLYCFCGTKLAYITRQAPFGQAQLADVELTVDFASETTPKDIVTVVATEPLTCDERWIKLKPGQFIVFHQGEVVFETQYEVPEYPKLPNED